MYYFNQTRMKNTPLPSLEGMVPRGRSMTSSEITEKVSEIISDVIDGAEGIKLSELEEVLKMYSKYRKCPIDLDIDSQELSNFTERSLKLEILAILSEMI